MTFACRYLIRYLKISECPHQVNYFSIIYSECPMCLRLILIKSVFALHHSA